MKKIVALVLSLVMVLGLATTAFAVEDKYDFYKADVTLSTELAKGTANGGTYILDEVGAKTNKDGSGNVAYIDVKNAETGAHINYWVKTTAPTINSYAVTASGKTDILFYVDYAGTDVGIFKYKASVKEFTDFGVKCGQLTVADPVAAASETYFVNAAGKVFKAADTVAAVQDNNYLLDGEIVTASNPAGSDTVKHSFLLNDFQYDSVKKVNVPTKAICTKCLMETTSIFKYNKIPATYLPQETTGTGAYTQAAGTGYLVALDVTGAAAAPSAPVVDTDKVESAETFDAGIAMYVGMSVMAAAGSAVVLKKKD